MRGHPTLGICIVRLTGKGYSKPPGTYGLIEEELKPGSFAIAWLAEEPFGGGGSLPVGEEDVELVGYGSLRLPTVNPPKRELHQLGTSELLDELYRRLAAKA